MSTPSGEASMLESNDQLQPLKRNNEMAIPDKYLTTRHFNDPSSSLLEIYNNNTFESDQGSKFN